MGYIIDTITWKKNPLLRAGTIVEFDVSSTSTGCGYGHQVGLRSKLEIRWKPIATISNVLLGKNSTASSTHLIWNYTNKTSLN
jgi:hypothetical protein